MFHNVFWKCQVIGKKNKKKLEKAKKKAILLHKEQGWLVESIKVAAENILKSYGIARAASHEGDFIGTYCWKLLASCDDIMITITQVFLDKKADTNIPNQEICQKCEEYCKLSQCLDSSFASLNIFSPNESDIQELDFRITETLWLWTQLGISVTTKAHLLTHCTK